MALFKKIIILNGLENKACTGIIKINTKSGYASAEVQLNSPKQLLLLLSTVDGVAAFDVEGDCVLNLSELKIKDEIECLVLENMKPIMFGSTVRDRLKCLNLKDEYIRQSSAFRPSKKESNKNEKSQEPPDVSAGKESVIKPDIDGKTNTESGDIAENLDSDTTIEKPISNTPHVEKKSIEKKVIDEQNPTKPKADKGGSEVNTDKKNEASKIKKCSVIDASKTDENIVSSILTDSVPYEGNNFYLAVKPQLDEMFICYPPDIELQKIVPNSKWIRVSLPDDYYVVGIVFNIDEPQYICYGLHGSFNQKPPSEIADICQWLPLNRDVVEGDGYWVIFQSAKTGLAEKYE